MAKINENLLVRGARGNVGKQFVYKKRGNDTHIAKMPVGGNKGEPTSGQAGIRDLFGAASVYARSVVADPDLKKQYQQKAGPGRTAFNMAFRDYFKHPVVQSIDTSKYNGNIGSSIVITAKDDFRVVEVFVRIHTALGVLVEEGMAILNPVDRNKWIYSATQNNTELPGTVISAVASDLPGNKAELELSL